MAKIKLAEGGFTLIPEGITIFKVMEVDDSKYENFGKLTVKLQTPSGQTHSETFTLVKKGGELNEGALKAWSYFARVCLNNYNLDEIDTQDIVGCYIQATVKHEEFTRTKGDRAGETGISVRLADYTAASSFKAAKAAAPKTDDYDREDDDIEDIDDFLND